MRRGTAGNGREGEVGGTTLVRRLASSATCVHVASRLIRNKLKVHPDKAPEELKAGLVRPVREASFCTQLAQARAKAAFEKVEKAAAVVEVLSQDVSCGLVGYVRMMHPEAFCETDMEATECLHRILHAVWRPKVKPWFSDRSIIQMCDLAVRLGLGELPCHAPRAHPLVSHN